MGGNTIVVGELQYERDTCSYLFQSYNKPCHCIFPSKDHLAYSTIWLTSLERQFVKTLTSVDVSFSKEVRSMFASIFFHLFNFILKQ